MRIALCEDDSVQADMFVRLLDKTADKLGIKAETDVYNCAEDMKEELNDKNISYDVYFLDIELGDDNGISLAKWIKAGYKEAVIVFITSHTDYMQKAFDVHAFNYIVKPAGEERLSMILSEINELYIGDGSKFIFHIGKSVYRIDYNDIVCIYSDMRYINIVTSGKEYRTYGKIKDIKEEFPSDMFGMAGSSMLINYKHISRIKSDMVWYKTGRESEEVLVSIARRYSREFVDGFNKYVSAI